MHPLQRVPGPGTQGHDAGHLGAADDDAHGVRVTDGLIPVDRRPIAEGVLDTGRRGHVLVDATCLAG